MAKVRMADIAQRLGISTVSVSKGLSGKDGVSDEMRRKILQTAKEMGYHARPDEADTGNSPTLGVIVAERFFTEEAFYYRLYTELLKQCQKQGLSLLMEIITPETEDGVCVPKLVQSAKIQGLILMGEFSDAYCKMIHKESVPAVYLDFYKDSSTSDCVLSDNLRGSMLLTEHLLKSGCKKITFVGSISATSSIMDRYLGYCKALLKFGIFPERSRRMEDRDEKGQFIPFRIPHDMPDAFMCNCDVVAFQIVKTLTEAGYRIPQDVAVTGYDDFRYADICSPPLTTYRIDVQGMAEAAIDLMRNKMNNSRFTAPFVVINGKMMVRFSTNPI